MSMIVSTYLQHAHRNTSSDAHIQVCIPHVQEHTGICTDRVHNCSSMSPLPMFLGIHMCVCDTYEERLLKGGTPCFPVLEMERGFWLDRE